MTDIPLRKVQGFRLYLLSARRPKPLFAIHQTVLRVDKHVPIRE